MKPFGAIAPRSLGSGNTAAILAAFYFAAQQNKRNHDELYILLSRMNERLRKIERGNKP